MIVNISLSFSLFALIFMLSRKKKNKSNEKTYKIMYMIILLLTLYAMSMLAQNTIGKALNHNLIYYEYLTGCAAEYIPVFVALLGLAYNNKNRNLKKIFYLAIIFPTIALITLWTNDLHQLFYIEYSTSLADTISGPMFKLNALYSYICFAVGIVNLVYTSLRRSGFFSIQTLFMFIGCSVPVIVNIMGATKIISLSVYVTPILFTVTAISFYIAIFKLKALNVIPVASRTVMDTMSDAYVVISNDGTIADSNKTFKQKFKGIFDFDNEDRNLFESFDKTDLVNLEELKKSIDKTRKNGEIVTQEYHLKNKKIDKYFEVDIHPIAARDNKKDYIATLLLFKDITQHKLDIKEIEEKQDIIVKQSQLVSIGELAGGVAHDINTPISAIKTGILMLNQSENRTEEEKQILERMDNCATKIINIVNSMRNQIRNLGGDTNVEFKISDVVNDIKVITYHEAKKNNSEVKVEIKNDLKIKGDPTKLGQVLTNLVVNGIQAYKEKNGGKIEVIVIKKDSKNALIKIQDYAGGIDETIAPYIFKNILTTKGTIGTGLGLYLAYSVIKGNFNGDITFETKKGDGTTFYITIPLK